MESRSIVASAQKMRLIALCLGVLSLTSVGLASADSVDGRGHFVTFNGLVVDTRVHAWDGQNGPQGVVTVQVRGAVNYTLHGQVFGLCIAGNRAVIRTVIRVDTGGGALVGEYLHVAVEDNGPKAQGQAVDRIAVVTLSIRRECAFMDGIGMALLAGGDFVVRDE